MIIAVDFSKNFRYIGLIVAREHLTKRGDFLTKASQIRHIAGMLRYEKTTYLHRFDLDSTYKVIPKVCESFQECQKLQFLSIRLSQPY